MQNIERIIDVNQNRCVEGLRVIEEYARFLIEDKDLSSKIRTLRHEIRKSLGQQWVTYRDSDNDVGLEVSASNRLDVKTSLITLLRANCSRVSESLRVLEEYLKILGYSGLSKYIETRRFTFYSVEKEVMAPFYVKGLYALTADGTEEEIFSQVKMFVAAEVPWLQYRDKVRTKDEIQVIAEKIAKLVKGSKTKFIVNDYPDVAEAVGAIGVHVGQGDMTVQEVREAYPTLLIGVSTHNKEQFDQAVADKPDYIALGPIFNTTTKQNPEDCEGTTFAEYGRSKTTLPLVGIGGINTTNIKEVMDIGIDSVAMIASIKTQDGLEAVMAHMSTEAPKAPFN